MAVAEFSISWEWEPAESIRTPELGATFARFNVRVGDESLTLVEDRASGSSRRSVYVSLYPLAEWIAYNWWNLNYDARPSKLFSSRSSDRLDSRHSVRASGDGFIWPDLAIVPEGRLTRLAWRADPGYATGAPIRYLTTGDGFARSDRVARELAHVVESTIDRLRDLGVTDTPLEEEWLALQDLDAEQEEFCTAVARLGLDPFGEGVKFEDRVLRAAATLGASPLLHDFLDAVSPREFDGSLDWVASGLVTVREGSSPEISPTFRLRQLVGARTTSSRLPWQVGWRQASIAREAAGVAPDEPLDLRPYLHEVSRPASDRGMIALGTAGEGASPTVVVGRGLVPTSRRFTLARAMWHQVTGDEGPFLVSNAYTERQRVERAFAAELLAPAEGIASLLETSPDEAQQDDLDAVADYYTVSTLLVQHQVENQLLGA